MKSRKARFHIPGQALVEHSLDSVESPTQSLPPCAGAGLVQSLDLDWLPPPHVTEQAPHVFQTDQLPSTMIICVENEQ